MKTNAHIRQKRTGAGADPENAGRRRAVKTIAGGVGALVAYHVLPATWSTPIVEQVFLPAHAAVRGLTLSEPCTIELVSGDQASSIDVIRVSGFVTPPVGGLQVGIAAVPNGGSGTPVELFTPTAADGSYAAEITLDGPGVVGIGVATGIDGAANISLCLLGIPPAQRPKPPSTTAAPTSSPPASDFTFPASNNFAVSFVNLNQDVADRLIGTLDYGNGSSQAIDSPGVGSGTGQTYRPIDYSTPGTYTLVWTPDPSSSSTRALLGLTSPVGRQNKIFDPAVGRTWTLLIT